MSNDGGVAGLLGWAGLGRGRSRGRILVDQGWGGAVVVGGGGGQKIASFMLI